MPNVRSHTELSFENEITMKVPKMNIINILEFANGVDLNAMAHYEHLILINIVFPYSLTLCSLTKGEEGGGEGGGHIGF